MSIISNHVSGVSQPPGPRRYLAGLVRLIQGSMFSKLAPVWKKMYRIFACRSAHQRKRIPCPSFNEVMSIMFIVIRCVLWKKRFGCKWDENKRCMGTRLEVESWSKRRWNVLKLDGTVRLWNAFQLVAFIMWMNEQPKAVGQSNVLCCNVSQTFAIHRPSF